MSSLSRVHESEVLIVNKGFKERKGSKCQRALIIYRTNLYSGNSQSVLVWAEARDKNARKKPRFAPAWSLHNIIGSLELSWSIVLDGNIRRDTFNSNSAVITSPHRATDRLMMQVKRIWALGNYDTENTFVVCVDQKGYWRLFDLEKTNLSSIKRWLTTVKQSLEEYIYVL